MKRGTGAGFGLIAFVAGSIALLFLVLALANNTGNGETPLQALGVTQPTHTPLPTPTPTSPLDTFRFSKLQNLTGTTTAVTGTGAVGTGSRAQTASTGGTSGSTAYIRTSTEAGYSLGYDQAVIDWSKRVSFGVRFDLTAATTNGLARVTLGKPSSTFGVCAVSCIGISLANRTLSVVAHNGSVLTSDATGVVVTTPVVTDVLITSHGDGSCSYEVRSGSNTVRDIFTGCPSTVGVSGQTAIYIEVDNGSDSATQRIVVQEIYVDVEQ